MNRAAVQATPGWLGSWSPPSAVRRAARASGERLHGLLDGPAWWILAAMVGVVPLAIGLVVGSWVHQPVTAAGLAFLLLTAARHDRPGHGMGALAVGFLAHTALAIPVAAGFPEASAAALPDGEAYWLAQETWIRTGVDPEYDPSTWVPHHLWLLVGIVALSFLSFGLTALMQGVYEVDLMNHYVGQFLTRSDAPLTSLLLGWHPWSVLRGLCYVVLVYEVGSSSYRRFAGLPPAPSRARRGRWALGLALFLADGLVKAATMPLVRDTLAAHLVE